MAINEIIGTAIDLIKLIQHKPTPVGLPFPFPPDNDGAPKIASGFTEADIHDLEEQTDIYGTPVVKITDANLGRYEFMPILIDDGSKQYSLPNSLIMIQGQKGIIETDVIDRGTVFEKVYERPYDISILVQIFDDINYKWPAQQFKEMAEMYRGNREPNKSRDLVTLKCALTNPFLQPENNFLITKFQLLDNGGSENMEVIQIDGRSNIDFELIIK